MLFLRQTDEPKGLPKKRVRTDFDLIETPLRMRIKRSLFAKKTALNKCAKGTLRGNLHHKKLNQRLNNQRLNNQKKSFIVTRQRLLRLCILLSLASMATHSFSASASVG